MSECHVHASGAIELYFYGELEGAERDEVARHVRACALCRQTLEELALIRSALDGRPDVSSPPGGDWTAFMRRLDVSVSQERRRQQAAGAVVFGAPRAARPAVLRPSFAGYLAMAALLALVTVSVLFVARSREIAAPSSEPSAANASAAAPRPAEIDPALATISEQHFRNSKLVLLGLTTKDAETPESWAYERERAGALLDDTRLYRLAAENRGMTRLAGVMRDLELVLLQTSMSDRADAGALARIQRLIRKRDLLEQMDTVTVAAARAGN
jgi:hypothetical protein